MQSFQAEIRPKSLVGKIGRVTPDIIRTWVAAGPGSVKRRLMDSVTGRNGLFFNPVVMADETGTIRGSYIKMVADPSDKKAGLTVSFKPQSCWHGKKYFTQVLLALNILLPTQAGNGVRRTRI